MNSSLYWTRKFSGVSLICILSLIYITASIFTLKIYKFSTNYGEFLHILRSCRPRMSSDPSLRTCSASNAFLITHDGSNNISKQYKSVPLEFDANPLRFNATSGFLVLTNCTELFLEQFKRRFPLETSFPPIILVQLWPGYTRPYIEQRLVDWKRQFGDSLKALVILGEYAFGGTSWELGAADQLRVMGISTREADYPVIQTKWEVWFDLRDQLTNASIINATVTDDGPNPWKALRRSFWFPLWMSITGVWSLANIGLAAYAVRGYACARVLAVVVLWMEIVSNFMRLPFLLDPFGVWYIPIPIIHVFFSMSWPLHTGIAVVVIFFWLELVTSRNIRTQAGFLTSKKWIAAVIVSILAAVEYTTAACRAAGLSSIMLNVNAALYLIVLLVCLIIYIWTYIKVHQFFKSTPSLRTNDTVLKSVSLRFLLTSMTFVFTIVIAILIVTPVYATSVGMSAVHFLVNLFINIGSSLTISAFLNRPSARRKSQSSAKGEISSRADVA